MGLWEFGNSRDPSVAVAEMLAAALLHGRPEWQRPPGAPPFGAEFRVWGVGVFQIPLSNRHHFTFANGYDPDARMITPTILVDQELVPPGLIGVRALEIPLLRESLLILSNESILERVVVLGISAPEPSLGPADTITSPLVGRLGCRVAWSSKEGFLTAGHVAGKKGSTVRSRTTTVGSVVFSSDPAGMGSQVMADVALIDLAQGLSIVNHFSGPTVGKPADAIMVHVSTNSSGLNQLMGFASWLHFPGSNGTFGDIYFTLSGITQPGHSGAPATTPAGEVIGHVVGASGAITTYIQDIHYQLRTIRGAPGLSAIQL